MDEFVWTGATRRAWGTGVVCGLVGGVLSAGVGAFTGLCCLFQFANAILPLLVGIVGGGVAAAVAKWEDMPREGAAKTGALLGVRGGGLATTLTGVLGFCFTLLWPVVSGAYQAVNTDQDVAVTLGILAASLAVSTGMAFLFTVVGVVGGVLLAAGAGAIAGFLRAS